jgi:hypothetical protein
MMCFSTHGFPQLFYVGGWTWGITRTNRPIDCRDCRGKMFMNMMVMGPMGFGDRPFWKTKHCRWLTLVALKNCSIRSDCPEKTNPKLEVCPTRKVFLSQEIWDIYETHLNRLGKNLAFSDLNTLELTFFKCSVSLWFWGMNWDRPHQRSQHVEKIRDGMIA